MVLVCHSTALPYPCMALSSLISVPGDKSLCEGAVSSSLSFYHSWSMYLEFSVRDPLPKRSCFHSPQSAHCPIRQFVRWKSERPFRLLVVLGGRGGGDRWRIEIQRWRRGRSDMKWKEVKHVERKAGVFFHCQGEILISTAEALWKCFWKCQFCIVVRKSKCADYGCVIFSRPIDCWLKRLPQTTTLQLWGDSAMRHTTGQAVDNTNKCFYKNPNVTSALLSNFRVFSFFLH